MRAIDLKPGHTYYWLHDDPNLDGEPRADVVTLRFKECLQEAESSAAVWIFEVQCFSDADDPENNMSFPREALATIVSLPELTSRLATLARLRLEYGELRQARRSLAEVDREAIRTSVAGLQQDGHLFVRLRDREALNLSRSASFADRYELRIILASHQQSEAERCRKLLNLLGLKSRRETEIDEGAVEMSWIFEGWSSPGQLADLCLKVLEIAFEADETDRIVFE